MVQFSHLKKYLLIVAFSCFCLAGWAQSLSAQQKKLQTDIMNYLKTEGFSPSIDEDGDIAFKKEGVNHYVIISKDEDSPFYLSISRYLSMDEDYNIRKAMPIINEANKYKGVKLLAYDTSIAVKAEMFLQSADHFKAVFNRLMVLLGYAANEFREEWSK
jgi:hypothetical protein